jgi:RNA-directed DNA polymerase
MAGSTEPENPPKRTSVDSVRSPQRQLRRRFHAPMDRVWRSDVLREAWEPVRENRGSAGVDRETIAEVEQRGGEKLLGELPAELKVGKYRPQAVLSLPRTGNLRGTDRRTEATVSL